MGSSVDLMESHDVLDETCFAPIDHNPTADHVPTLLASTRRTATCCTVTRPNGVGPALHRARSHRSNEAAVLSRREVMAGLEVGDEAGLDGSGAA
jgi:hypothetical protein